MRYSFPVGHFDIFFRHYLRRLNISHSDYAVMIGLDPKTVAGVADGTLYPPSRILDDMRVKIQSTRVDMCVWDADREINEI